MDWDLASDFGCIPGSARAQSPENKGECFEAIRKLFKAKQLCKITKPGAWAGLGYGISSFCINCTGRVKAIFAGELGPQRLT
jgi:hypothetical protein